jgi:hypothetical protein
MRSCRFLTVLVLLAVLMSNVVSGVSAQEKGGQSILNKSASQIEEVDLEQFVDLIFAWQVTIPQVKMLYERLDTAQQQTFKNIVLARFGGKADSKPILVESAGINAPPGVKWAQTIENVWTWGKPPGSSWPYTWYTDAYCDDDPSDNEYVFVYSFNSSNPDGIRWTTDNPAFYSYALAAWGGNILGYGYSFNEARLCVSDGSVNLTGGVGVFMATTFIHY